MPGVYIDRDLVMGGLGAQEADGGWSSDEIFSGQIDPQLGFGINAKGLFAVAYYDNGTSQLFYVESSDGIDVVRPAPVDTDGSRDSTPPWRSTRTAKPGHRLLPMQRHDTV